jgi:hypothetical protein
MLAWAEFASGSSLTGYVGAGIVVLAYFLNQNGALKSTDWRFPAVNLCGSVLVLISLLYHLNPPSVVIELFWCSISLYGMGKNLRAAGRVRR